jgi:hypothetical protein
MFDAKRAAPTTPQGRDLPARKKTWLVTFVFREVNTPMKRISRM